MTHRGLYIKQSYPDDFVNLMDRLYRKYGEGIFSIQGIADKHMDIVGFSKSFFAKSADRSNVADISVDANANVKEKNITQYHHEIGKAASRLNGLFLLHKYIKEDSGKIAANRTIEHIVNGQIFLSDSHSVNTPYCYAFSLLPLLFDGMNFYKDLNIKPPKRPESFINVVIQSVAYFSNQIVGACALPDFFPIFDKFLREKYGDGYVSSLKRADRKVIENLFQHFIYSINYPFRGAQSPFTNLSVLDREFLKQLFEGYAFPDGSGVDIESTYGLSKWFFEYFDGINCEESMFTFPVMTLATSLSPEGDYLDEEFVDWCAKVNCEKSMANIFQDQPTSFASCCFHGNEEVDVVFIKGDSKVEGRNIRFNTICDLYAGKYSDHEMYAYKPDGTLGRCCPVSLSSVGRKLKLIEIVTAKGTMIVTHDHIFPTVIKWSDFNEPSLLDKRAENLTVGDYLYDGDTRQWDECRVSSVQDYNHAVPAVYCLEMEEEPYFKLSNGIITHNCRLRNDFSKLNAQGYTNSFGVGSLQIGSHRVCGLNLPRLALLEQDNPNAMDESLESIHRVLKAHRRLIKDRIDGGFLPLYAFGWMDLSKQYGTVGLLGSYEYLTNLGKDITIEEDRKVLLDKLSHIEEKILQWQAEDDTPYNIESIPGESMAVRLAEIDTILEHNPDEHTLYSNQYLPLTAEASLHDRLVIQGEFDSLTSGGAILHINVDDEKPIGERQYRRLIKVAKDHNVKYFGVNYAYSECSAGHMVVGKHDTCTVCEANIVEQYCRVVGFITPVSAWNKVRRIEEFPERVFYNNKEVDSDKV